jgi:signal transduction histidine kinase
MASLVESLLYLAKVDFQDNPNFERLNLSEILDEVLLPLEAVMHEKKIDLKMDLAENVFIQGERPRIHRLFGVLIDNAIKHSDGKISIKLDKNAIFTIRNSGKHIPAEKVDKLFDRFFRADESHKYTGGFGLGLSIAKAIVDRHKAEITCTSSEKDGVTFKVTFALR